jgi:hypothetical protein
MKTRAAISLCAAALLVAASFQGRGSAAPPLPPTLGETGLFERDTLQVRAANQPFAPAHALWTDGMEKRRWLYLPPGTSVAKSNPDGWEFPVGTRAWKEFSRPGGRVETRFIERSNDGSWRFASYVWNAQGTQAVLAPEDGDAKLGIPSRADCLACHDGAPVPILGYSAVQLERTIAARSDEERMALGYLHGNCGHCHNAVALGGTGLFFAQSAADPTKSAALARASAASRAQEILRRLRSSNPYVRMPPLGVSVTDAEGVAAVNRWIQQLDPAPGETHETHRP